MSRLLLALLLLLLPIGTTRAHALAVTDSLVFPSYGGTHLQYYPVTKNQLWCWRLPTRLGVTNARKFAAGIVTGGPTGAICGFALYVDDNAGARLATMAPACDLGLAGGVVSVSGLTPFSLVQAVVYRLCTCVNYSGSPGAADTPSYLAVYEGGPNLNGDDTTSKASVLNAATTRVGTAANPCVAGVPPSTTGALTPAVVWSRPNAVVDPAMPPVVVIEP